MLKDTEKRWEVIDIDNEDDNTNESRKKKRKVSLSPQGNTNSNDVASSTAVDQELRNIYNSSTYSSNNNLSQIVVEGCGQPDMNGINTPELLKLIQVYTAIMHFNVCQNGSAVEQLQRSRKSSGSIVTVSMVYK